MSLSVWSFHSMAFAWSSVLFFVTSNVVQNSITDLQNLLMPVVEDSTDWAVDVGLKITALYAFYALILSRLLK